MNKEDIIKDLQQKMLKTNDDLTRRAFKLKIKALKSNTILK